MKGKVTTGARLLLGLIFVVFGANGFFQFLPMPPMPEEAGKAIGGLFAISYMFPLVKSLEILAGLALLAGYFVPLALLVLSPIVVNIFLFHIFYTPSDAALSVLIVALQITAAASVWGRFQTVLSPK